MGNLDNKSKLSDLEKAIMKKWLVPVSLKGVASLSDLNSHRDDLSIHFKLQAGSNITIADDEHGTYTISASVTADDKVEVGDMNAVTSNAVALSLAGKQDTLPYVEKTFLELIGQGHLWMPGTYGSVNLSGTDMDGISMQSKGATARVELSNSGSVVITSTQANGPQWLDASTDTPAFYNIVTTKAIDPASVTGRIASLETNSHNMRTLTFSDKHGTVQVVAYYGDTIQDFLGVCFPYGFEISGKTWYMMSKNEFDSLAVTSGTTKTITSTGGDRVYYNPGATGGNAVFRVDTLYNGVQGGVTPAWGVSTNFGSITVSQPAAYALPTPQEAARIRMLEIAANAADDRVDRAERALHNLGKGLLQLSEDDISFAYPGTNNNGAFSLSGGTLRMTGGGGVSAVMLSKAARHFEATTTADQKFAVMVVCKPGDNTGGAGVFIVNPGNNANIFVCDSSAHAINNTSAVSGYTRQSSVAAGRLVVDVIDMTDAPQAGTGYTKRVVVKLGSATVLDTYVDAGIGNLSAYTEPRIGLLGSWAGSGSWTMTDCKVSYGGNTAKDVPPAPETTLPAVLLHNHVYSVEVSSGTVDLSGKTVEARATCELCIDYTGGTLVLPALWWLDGASSTDGDHDIPPWGQDMEANHRYVVTLRNDGRKMAANLAYDYPL